MKFFNEFFPLITTYLNLKTTFQWSQVDNKVIGFHLTYSNSDNGYPMKETIIVVIITVTAPYLNMVLPSEYSSPYNTAIEANDAGTMYARAPVNVVANAMPKGLIPSVPSATDKPTLLGTVLFILKLE